MVAPLLKTHWVKIVLNTIAIRFFAADFKYRKQLTEESAHTAIIKQVRIPPTLLGGGPSPPPPVLLIAEMLKPKSGCSRVTVLSLF